MMTQQLGFSILTAPLAAIDRRALSQAWYSALHLAHEAPSAAQAVIPKAAPCRPGGMPRIAASPPLVLRSGEPRIVTIADARKHTRVAGAEEERRAPRSSLARKIERCFLDPARRIQRASFTVDGTNARVHVALQESARGLRLVAVCPPSLRDRVTRALDEARYALAARGISLAVDVHAEPA